MNSKADCLRSAPLARCYVGHKGLRLQVLLVAEAATQVGIVTFVRLRPVGEVDFAKSDRLPAAGPLARLS